MNFNSVFVLFLALFVHQFIFIYAPPSVTSNSHAGQNTGCTHLSKAQAGVQPPAQPSAQPPATDSENNPQQMPGAWNHFTDPYS